MKRFSKRWLVLVLLMGVLLLTLTGCGNTWGQTSVIWTMCVFFFWMIYIWMFIAVFSDIFRRNDLGGGRKAMWIIFVIFLPLLGILIYMIARPKMTEQDKQMVEEAQAHQKRAAGYSAAEEIAKAQALKDSGAISEEEFQELKRKALI
jgi:flagellar biosynthesis/type III secretory pathway M-ring protein FliF/YscJ